MMPLADFFCIHKIDLVRNIVSRNMKLKFRRSYLGFFWSLLVPLCMSFTYMVLFQYIMRIQMAHYLPFILFNVMTWSYFAVACMEGLETIVANYGILSKVPVPIHIFNFSSIITNAIYFFASFPVILLFVMLDGLAIDAKYLLIPGYALLFFMMTYFISVLLGIVFIYFRDIRHLFGVILQLWMYATPILYPYNMLPKRLTFLIYLNPLAALFVSFQKIIFEGELPSLVHLGIILAWVVFFFILSYVVYNFAKDKVLENV